jgi:hypothetical protein
MQNYLILLVIFLLINLVYTFKHDMGMFLFILLLISACLYLQELLVSEISLLKNELNTFVGSLINNIESDIKDTIKTNIKPNIPSNIYSKLSKT